MSSLRDRLHHAAGPDARFPVDTIGARVQRRRHVRVAASSVAAVMLAVSLGVGVVPQRHLINLEVGAGPAARTVDIDLTDAPTWLPDDYRRCGDITHERDVTTQRFCNGTGQDLVLRFGPHDQLPEIGSQVGHVHGRPVYVEVHDGTRVVTISDRQTADDRHYRAEAPLDVPTSSLVEVIVSIPAFMTATGIE